MAVRQRSVSSWRYVKSVECGVCGRGRADLMARWNGAAWVYRPFESGHELDRCPSCGESAWSAFTVAAGGGP